MKNFIWAALLLATFGTKGFADPIAAKAPDYGDPKNIIDDYSRSDYAFLYPGFRFVIQGGADGGPSITALYDGEGFILCASLVDVSNIAIPPPLHCNTRITPPGFHVPARVLFGKDGIMSKIKIGLKWTGIGGPLIAEALSAQIPLGAEAANATANVESGQSAAQKPVEAVQLRNTLSMVKSFSTIGEKNCDSTYPVALSPYFVTDLYRDLQDRERDYEKKCMKYARLSYDEAKALSSTKNDPDILYCHVEAHNQDLAANAMTVCQLGATTANAGEKGSPDIWFPGQLPTDPAGCVTALKQLGKITANGTPILAKNSDWNNQPSGSTTMIYLNDEWMHLKGMAPTTGQNEVSDHVQACLDKNPKAQTKANATLVKAKTAADELLAAAAAATPPAATTAAPAASSATAPPSQ